MGPKKLVLLVEGDGDVKAAPVLVKQLLRHYSAFDALILNEDKEEPLRVGDYSNISRNQFDKWKRYLKSAIKRRNCGACLLLLDGDCKLKVEGQPFCAMRAARLLAAEAEKVGAGKLFSAAIVFACMEFESWLIPCTNSFVNKPFSDGRKEILNPADKIPLNPEVSPRDAKGWFRKIMQTGYKPTRDQEELTRLADLNQIRSHPEIRSFRRLESAIKEIIEAIRDGKHIISPI
ncbi:MAG: DUF4276 family protein [Pirellulales bacterium]|nr:DUF4276 family protein [Pirellulales bacterium]